MKNENDKMEKDIGFKPYHAWTKTSAPEYQYQQRH